MTFCEDMLRLYAVTDRHWTGAVTLMEQVEAAISGGATMVQLREKDMADDALLASARDMAALCHRLGVPLIVNDRADIALASGADGVHLGQSDGDPAAVRAKFGRDFIIGVTAKTVEQATRACEAEADYLGSGAVFGSSTKTNALPMSRETLGEITRCVPIPVVAIGGINKTNIAGLRGTGIKGVAVVSGIFAESDIQETCRILRRETEIIAQNDG